MVNLFQILDNCNGVGPVVSLIKNGVFPIIQIGIPILLILMGTIDLGKAVVSNDDKEIKGATSKLIKRAIMAVAVFFVVTLVSVVMGWLSNAGGDVKESNWKSCWNNPLGDAGNSDD